MTVQAIKKNAPWLRGQKHGNLFFCCTLLLLISGTAQGKDFSTTTAFLDSLFSSIDSTLLTLQQSPALTNKASLPVKDLFVQTLSRHPEIQMICRTNNRGKKITEIVRNRAVDTLQRYCKGEDWFAIPAAERRSFYGPVVEGRNDQSVFWSKPLFSTSETKKQAFTGVLAIRISLKKIFSELQITHNQHLVVRYQRKMQNGAKNFSDTTANTITYPLKGNTILRITERNMQSEQNGKPPFENSENRGTSNSEEAQKNLSAPDTPAKKSTSSPPPTPYIFGFLGGVVLMFIVGKTRLGNFFTRRHEVEKDLYKEKVANQLREEVPDEEIDKIRKIVIGQIYTEIRHQIKRAQGKRLRESAAQSVKEDIRRDTEEVHGDEIKKQVEEELRSQLRNEVQQSVKKKFITKDREKLVKEIEQQLRKNETAALRESLRKKIAAEITETLRKEESDEIRSASRSILIQKLTSTITAKEKKSLEHSIRRQLESSLYSEIASREKQNIEDRLRARLEEEIKDSLDHKEMELRILKQEGERLRELAKKRIYGEELEIVHEKVRDDIYHSTVDDLKRSLRRDLRKELDKESTQQQREIDTRIRKEIARRIRPKYHKAVTDIDSVSNALYDIKPLKSLTKQIQFLDTERKKYKYFNLNKEQTENLVQYLKTLSHEFNLNLDTIYHDLELIGISLSSIMNVLDDVETQVLP